MLVLSRKADEVVVLTLPGGPQIRFTICSIKNDKASVGIDAPRNVTVHREEVQRRVDAIVESPVANEPALMPA